MSQSSRNTFSLVLLVVIILIAFLFLTPAFRFSCSRIFLPNFTGMHQTIFHNDLFYPPLGLLQYLPLLVMFVLWGAVSVWVYHDAERRGHSGLLWGLFVFIGNIIGLIIYLILRVSSSDLAASPPPSVSAACPSCGRTIQESYVACPYCGVGLTRKCGQCGKNAEPDWRMCPYCGHDLRGDAPAGSI
jgi:RNA polymerase subunit RPABC4/transcription elongation factor Spt4